jgi:hypothetical protein
MGCFPELIGTGAALSMTKAERCFPEFVGTGTALNMTGKAVERRC